jgi:TonB family protein
VGDLRFALREAEIVYSHLGEETPVMKPLLALLTFTLCIAAHAAEFQRTVQSMDIPTYPPLAYQLRIQGTVKLSVVVDGDGHVTKATVTSGHRLLQAAASENVKTWRFVALPSSSSSEIAITYVYKIEGKEIPYAEPDKRRSRVSLDLPASVEVAVSRHDD